MNIALYVDYLINEFIKKPYFFLIWLGIPRIATSKVVIAIEQCAVVKFLAKEGMKTSDLLLRMRKQFDEEC